jgi:hypothetical protein
VIACAAEFDEPQARLLHPVLDLGLLALGELGGDQFLGDLVGQPVQQVLVVDR